MKKKQKCALVLACALALGVSGHAYALEASDVLNYNDVLVADDQGAAANDASTIFGANSLNDNILVDEVDVAANKAENGSAAATGASTAIGEIEVDASKTLEVDVDKVSTDNSASNDAKDHSAAVNGEGDATAYERSNNAGSFNTVETNTTTTFTVGDIAVEVALSELEGAVTGNSYKVAPDSYITSGDNAIKNSLTNPNGINVVSQNSGASSLLQQSVNVQLNGIK